jgi:hypothetical protein
MHNYCCALGMRLAEFPSAAELIELKPKAQIEGIIGKFATKLTFLLKFSKFNGNNQ